MNTLAVKSPPRSTWSALNFRLEDLLDSSHYTILGGDHNYPLVPTEVIHEQQEVLVTPRCRRCDWTTQVVVH
jgi:hypothetical protein